MTWALFKISLKTIRGKTTFEENSNKQLKSCLNSNQIANTCDLNAKNEVNEALTKFPFKKMREQISFVEKNQKRRLKLIFSSNQKQLLSC